MLAYAGNSIPVRIRIIRGSNQGAPGVDASLNDLKNQLARVGYSRWQQVSSDDVEMEFGKSTNIDLPEGEKLTLILEESSKDTVTFKVKLPAHKTFSKLTITKDKRIVHQVADERNGAAHFASIRPWP